MQSDKKDNEIKSLKNDKKKEETKPKMENDTKSKRISKDDLYEFIYDKCLQLQSEENRFLFLEGCFFGELDLNININELMGHMRTVEEFKRNINDQIIRKTFKEEEDVKTAFNKFLIERGFPTNDQNKKSIKHIEIEQEETDFQDPTINEEDIIHYDENGNPID